MEYPCNNHVATFCREEAVNDECSPLSEAALGIKGGEYTFKYTYPLSTTAEFKHVVTEEASIIDILVRARLDYENIYQIEEQEDGSPGMIPGMLNRRKSNGAYGIWGHVLSDLYFEGVIVDEAEKTISFHIGS
jgi:hypothetical protein